MEHIPKPLMREWPPLGSLPVFCVCVDEQPYNCIIELSHTHTLLRAHTHTHTHTQVFTVEQKKMFFDWRQQCTQTLRVISPKKPQRGRKYESITDVPITRTHTHTHARTHTCIRTQLGPWILHYPCYPITHTCTKWAWC